MLPQTFSRSRSSLLGDFLLRPNPPLKFALMQSETSLTDKTMGLQVEKADRAPGYLDGVKHGDIVEGDHHLMTRKILWNLDIR